MLNNNKKSCQKLSIIVVQSTLWYYRLSLDRGEPSILKLLSIFLQAGNDGKFIPQLVPYKRRTFPIPKPEDAIRRLHLLEKEANYSQERVDKSDELLQEVQKTGQYSSPLTGLETPTWSIKWNHSLAISTKTKASFSTPLT